MYITSNKPVIYHVKVLNLIEKYEDKNVLYTHYFELYIQYYDVKQLRIVCTVQGNNYMFRNGLDVPKKKMKSYFYLKQ